MEPFDPTDPHASGTPQPGVTRARRRRPHHPAQRARIAVSALSVTALLGLGITIAVVSHGPAAASPSANVVAVDGKRAGSSGGSAAGVDEGTSTVQPHTQSHGS